MSKNSDFSLDEVKYGFTGITTFMRSELVNLNNLKEKNPTIVVMGVPFDEGAPFMPGSRFGPRSIREHSLRFNREGIYDHQNDKMMLGEELSRDRMVDIGDVNVIPTDVVGTFD